MKHIHALTQRPATAQFDEASAFVDLMRSILKFIEEARMILGLDIPRKE